MSWTIGPILLCVWLIHGGDTAGAQEATSQPEARAADERHGPPGPDQPAGVERRQHGPERAEARSRGGWHRSILEPSEQDFGPLAAGEEETLRKFVKDELPRLALLLRHIEEQNPRAASQGFERLVPRLRQLRRIHGENPALADLIEQHAANIFREEMLRRTWSHAGSERREVIEDQMRACVAENVRLEAEALTLWADDLRAHRDERIAQRLEHLTQGAAELATEPQEIRDGIAELAAATSETQRHELKDKLGTMIGQRLDHQIAAIRRRIEQLKDNAPQEVDRRVQRLLESPGRHRP